MQSDKKRVVIDNSIETIQEKRIEIEIQTELDRPEGEMDIEKIIRLQEELKNTCIK
ncbi:hypothetical protein KAR91_51010 [Candidatus Pacearchaeota archaeon]|nr:hypothetical protein [Candidatus Pacearchaeota archaeon]